MNAFWYLMRRDLLRGGVRVGRRGSSLGRLLTSRDLLRGVGIGRVRRCSCALGGLLVSRCSLERRLGIILRPWSDSGRHI